MGKQVYVKNEKFLALQTAPVSIASGEDVNNWSSLTEKKASRYSSCAFSHQNYTARIVSAHISQKSINNPDMWRTYFLSYIAKQDCISEDIFLKFKENIQPSKKRGKILEICSIFQIWYSKYQSLESTKGMIWWFVGLYKQSYLWATKSCALGRKKIFLIVLVVFLHLLNSS